jgi:hypothetical protein
VGVGQHEIVAPAGSPANSRSNTSLGSTSLATGVVGLFQEMFDE